MASSWTASIQAFNLISTVHSPARLVFPPTIQAVPHATPIVQYTPGISTLTTALPIAHLGITLILCYIV